MNSSRFVWLLPVLLAGCDTMKAVYDDMPCIWFCTDQTKIQSKYIDKRDRCQELAELKLPLYIKPTDTTVDDKTRNAQLLAIFSECMHREDWSVTGPKVEPSPATPPGTVPPVTPPAITPPVALGPGAPAYAYTRQQPPTTAAPAPTLVPPSTMPQTYVPASPPVATTPVPPPPPAAYAPSNVPPPITAPSYVPTPPPVVTLPKNYLPADRKPVNR